MLNYFAKAVAGAGLRVGWSLIMATRLEGFRGSCERVLRSQLTNKNPVAATAKAPSKRGLVPFAGDEEPYTFKESTGLTEEERPGYCR